MKEQTDLTAREKHNYLKHKGMYCPKCKSGHVESDPPDIDGPVGYANCICTDCHYEWVDVWKLVDVEAAEFVDRT